MRKLFLLTMLFTVSTVATLSAQKPCSCKDLLDGKKQPSQVNQNKQAKLEGLKKLENDKDLKDYKNKGYLVHITPAVKVDTGLPEKWSYTLKRSNEFLYDMADSFQMVFGATGDSLQINSAVRTIPRQLEIINKQKNGNAKAIPVTTSSHLYGATVDMAKNNLTPKELKWVRNYICRFKRLGLIEAVEENSQPVFHIMVFRKYSKYRIPNSA